MEIYIILGIILTLILICLLISFICFMKVFFSPKRKVLKDDEYEVPPGKMYEPFHEEMIQWIKEIRAMPHEDVQVTSFDGLTLRGKYFEYKKGAPIELMFNGYQGSAERDLCGGVKRCFALERNVIIIDQRAHGKSDGSVTTFGIKERKDCLKWIDFTLNKFGKETKIILTGISMGAATVMMAGGEDLPNNVLYILADCGYTSAKDIIKKVIREMHLPDKILYPFVKLGAFIFGHFNLDETSPLEAIKKCKTPIILFHGESDSFVPCDMSKKIYEISPSIKEIVLVKDAEHGLSYPIDKNNYLNNLKEFEKKLY